MPSTYATAFAAHHARGSRFRQTCSAWMRKIARIESGVRQKTFGSCDLIMEGETGDAKCLTPSALAPPVSGALVCRAARYAAEHAEPRLRVARLRVRFL